MLGAEAEPLAAPMIVNGIGELQGKGAEPHHAWLYAAHGEDGGEHGPVAFTLDWLEAGLRLQLLPAVHLGAKIHLEIVGKRQKLGPDRVFAYLSMYRTRCVFLLAKARRLGASVAEGWPGGGHEFVKTPLRLTTIEVVLDDVRRRVVQVGHEAEGFGEQGRRAILRLG